MTTARHSRHLSNSTSTFSTSRATPHSICLDMSLFCEPLASQRRLASAVLSLSERNDMFKISTVDTPHERRLVVEGTLVNPWVAELRRSWSAAGGSLERRKLVIGRAHV